MTRAGYFNGNKRWKLSSSLARRIDERLPRSLVEFVRNDRFERIFFFVLHVYFTRSFEFLFGYKVVKVEEEGYRRVGGRRTTRPSAPKNC